MHYAIKMPLFQLSLKYTLPTEDSSALPATVYYYSVPYCSVLSCAYGDAESISTKWINMKYSQKESQHLTWRWLNRVVTFLTLCCVSLSDTLPDYNEWADKLYLPQENELEPVYWAYLASYCFAHFLSRWVVIKFWSDAKLAVLKTVSYCSFARWFDSRLVQQQQLWRTAYGVKVRFKTLSTL